SLFAGANGETFPALEEVDLSPQLPPSARERRRIKKKALEYGNQMDLTMKVGHKPDVSPDSVSVHSDFSLVVDQMKGKNEDRLRRLAELGQKSAHPGDDISLGEADDLLKPPLSRDGRRPSSTDSIATEPWLRPGTSATLRRFLVEQQSPAKLPAESALPLGWQGLSTAHG
ncbi:CSPP1 protein, partial [Penelope pileata]|nr:CSPP1 protein [Penelope pileata]